MPSWWEDACYYMYIGLEAERISQIALVTDAIELASNVTDEVVDTILAPVTWVVVALQGDWNDNRTPAQIAADSILSMIPIIDLIFDIRDLAANCKKLNDDLSDKGAWLSFCLCLIGLFPTAGSLVKGVLKILFVYAKKFGDYSVIVAVDKGIAAVNMFLTNEKVVKIIKSWDIGKCYTMVADKARELAGLVSSSSLAAKFKNTIDNFALLIKKLESFPGIPDELILSLKGKHASMVAIREKMDEYIASCLGPLSYILNGIAKRLDEYALAASAGAGKGACSVAEATKAVNEMSAAAHAPSRATTAAAEVPAGSAAKAADAPAELPAKTPEGTHKPQTETTTLTTDAEKKAQSDAQNPNVAGDTKLGREDMPQSTNAEKALFGEVVSDDYMQRAGHTPMLDIDRDPIDNLPLKSRDNYLVDGVYKKNPPPKKYIITEAKYRTNGKFTESKLPSTKGSTKGDTYYPEARQMDDDWILPRLKKDPALMREDIRDMEGNYERWVLVVDPDRNVTNVIKL